MIHQAQNYLNTCLLAEIHVSHVSSQGYHFTKFVKLHKKTGTWLVFIIKWPLQGFRMDLEESELAALAEFTVT